MYCWKGKKGVLCARLHGSPGHQQTRNRLRIIDTALVHVDMNVIYLCCISSTELVIKMAISMTSVEDIQHVKC